MVAPDSPELRPDSVTGELIERLRAQYNIYLQHQSGTRLSNWEEKDLYLRQKLFEVIQLLLEATATGDPPLTSDRP